VVLAVWVLMGCGTHQTSSGDTGLIKVLPHYLDKEGQHSDGPTLLHRDSHQNRLIKNPELVHSIRYDVQWFGEGEVTLRLELRSGKRDSNPIIKKRTLSAGLGFNHWSSIDISPEIYREFGQPYSWQVSLWRDKKMLDKRESFLW
tara:strand:+ start:253 stop:687 length:435 start_codon:yes stop_codon:yes gene_type:complete